MSETKNVQIDDDKFRLAYADISDAMNKNGGMNNTTLAVLIDILANTIYLRGKTSGSNGAIQSRNGLIEAIDGTLLKLVEANKEARFKPL